MELFINESLGLYPRHPGDIKLIDPNWEPGMPLPEGWEEVMMDEPPVIEPHQTWEEISPVKVDGVWHRNFLVRDLTIEEMEERKANTYKPFVE